MRDPAYSYRKPINPSADSPTVLEGLTNRPTPQQTFSWFYPPNLRAPAFFIIREQINDSVGLGVRQRSHVAAAANGIHHCILRGRHSELSDESAVGFVVKNLIGLPDV